MQVFDVLGSPVRRRILERLAEGPQTSGAIVEAIQREVDITQPAVSQHLAVLRENGFATVRAEGAKRVYEVATERFGEVDAWLERFRGSWERRLDALETEVARGKRERRVERAKESVRRRA
jgi:DNA-binding transcriptional ArsR family regulator